VEEPAREFFCAVSLELLREPQQTDCCGHHLSVEVAQRLQGEGKPCPVCQKPHFTTHPDLFHKRRMQQSIVRCTYKKNGCEWEGELGNLEDHVTKCPKRLWQCVYCAFSGLGEVEGDHLSGCGQFPVPCPNGCEAGSVERCSLEWHLLECPLQLVGCEYVAMGCAVRLPRREMSEHIRQSGQEHLLKMCAANLTVSRELSRKVEEKEQQIAELQEEMRRMEGRLTKKIENVQLQVTDIHSEVAITVPPVEYTIHNFSALKAQNKEWRSPPFYTRPGEYKMRMGVWPNGLGEGKRSHVSIRFYTMADAHTEYLRWPATLPVTIRVLNQTTGSGRESPPTALTLVDANHPLISPTGPQIGTNFLTLSWLHM